MAWDELILPVCSPIRRVPPKVKQKPYSMLSDRAMMGDNVSVYWENLIFLCINWTGISCISCPYMVHKWWHHLVQTINDSPLLKFLGITWHIGICSSCDRWLIFMKTQCVLIRYREQTWNPKGALVLFSNRLIIVWWHCYYWPYTWPFVYRMHTLATRKQPQAKSDHKLQHWTQICCGVLKCLMMTRTNVGVWAIILVSVSKMYTIWLTCSVFLLLLLSNLKKNDFMIMDNILLVLVYFWFGTDSSHFYSICIYIDIYIYIYSWHGIDGIVQERHNSIANVMELRIFCTNPLEWMQCSFLHKSCSDPLYL